MSAATSLGSSPVQGAPGMGQNDPWVVQPRERARYEDQFKSLRPINGIVTGEQAKGFMLQSQLPPLILGQIWSLSDTDADGKMDINEFSIACKLINLKLRGFEIPKTLPPSLLNSLKNSQVPPAIPPLPAQMLNSAAQNTSAPMRPQPPKAAPPLVTSSPLIASQAAPVAQPLIPGIGSLVQPIQQQPLAPLMKPNAPNLIQPMHSNLVQTAPIPISQPLIQAAAPSAGNIISGAGLIQPVGGPSLIQNVSLSQSLPQTAPVIPGSLNYSAPIAAIATASGGSSAAGTPQAKSISSLDSPAQQDWAIPHQAKLKYTQLFNTTDRMRTGYLSGVQARNLMLQSKLPQAILAQIWALSDMDSDGRLGCDEFVLAMYLCEQATIGKMPPAKLSLEMIPPAFRRSSISSATGATTVGSRHGSISSQGSQPADADPASSLLQTTFEDKRKENFEKGQAELERRRRALLEAQRAEAEARERKEREEQERRERARAEQERRRQQELQQQLQEQMEKERQLEEERKRQQEQRDAARREMERQRQLEWEKQRSQELQQQRQRAQENVLRLKARNQSLTIELNTLTDQVKELSQKICDTRVGVSNVKTTIDGMRVTRDTHMQELSQLKNKLKDQNARLIALSQEKIKLDAKNKQNDNAETQAAFDNKEIAIKNLKEKLSNMEEQINGKMSDIENNNIQINELTTHLTVLVSDCETLYVEYEEKKTKVLQMKGMNKTSSLDYSSTWKDTAEWPSTDWPVDNGAPAAQEPPAAGMVKYRALYEFVARNQDEISFQPGDAIMVPAEQNGEPGWLAGEIRGHMGWFPQSYAEPVDTTGTSPIAAAEPVSEVPTNVIDDGFTASRPLEGIAEVPEIASDNSQPAEQNGNVELNEQRYDVPPAEDISDYYVACYPYQSIEQGDLSFNAGDVIIVVKKEGDWWTGKIGENVGIFPSNYVQKAEVATENNNAVTNESTNNTNTEIKTPNGQAITATMEKNAQNEMQSDFTQSANDAEITAINEKQKTPDKSPDFAAMASNTQTIKSSKKPEIATVIAPYQATSPEQLTLSRGQLIMIRKKSDSGWWEGELQAKGRKRQVGWFPATYVKILESSGRSSGRNTPVSASRVDQQEVVLDKVIAIFPYTAQNADELTFIKDDIISVTARDEPSWWRGELNGVSGLFPSNYVGPLQSQLSPQEKKRQEYIWELISSEKAYIEDMSIVHEVFEQPLIESRVLSSEQVSKIFLNWQEILQCNYNFHEDLKNRYDDSYGNVELIGDIICRHIPQMTPYIQFCSSQLSAASFLQSLTENSTAFQNTVRKCQTNPKTKGMPLSSFLIKPMQRITKYPLIISKILENTNTNHQDHPYLTQALQKSDRFCKQINEGVRFTENTERLNWIQKNVNLEGLQIIFNSETNGGCTRKFLHYGHLTKVKSGKELVGFLMSDFLLLAQPSRPFSNGYKFSFEKSRNISFKIYKQPIFLNEIALLKDSFDNEVDSNRTLKLKSLNKIYYLLTPTANECTLWLKRITDAIINFDHFNNKNLYRQRSNVSRVASQGRLFVNVKQGARFQRITGRTVCENVFCKLKMAGQVQTTSVTNAVIRQQHSQQSNQNSGPLANAVFEWNATMQFQVYNIETDVLELIVLEKCLYSPNQFLGRADVKVWDILNETQSSQGPVKKKMILHQVESGEVLIKLDLRLFET